ncbi:MAG: c-type cytochrome [Phycisphaera sp.]|nr:c-type cytochrome [Phycisphaera sp.]
MTHRFSCLAVLLIATTSLHAQNYDLDAVPNVPDGFKVNIFAKEPNLLHPAAMCFDSQGRMFVGGGPQFRKPMPDTPPDSIKIVLDTDGDGVADKFKTFATGFNCIQALAWKGNDLYVANCPDLTIVRDTDGDDVADEYELVYTGLGHLRHGLHGFNFGPDGKLYMTQGNAGAQPNAPMAFRELMHIESDLPDNQPINRVYKPGEYKHSYIDKWPTTEGGMLRCDPHGHNLEIYSRGNRNPWDAAFDDGFNWLATDNDDGPESDRIISPFWGSHFGKRHTWSYSWTGEDNPCTVPMSGIFPSANGSGVGVVFYTAEQFPEKYRNTFLIGDWTRKEIYAFRRRWDGALLTGDLEIMVTAGGTKSLFRPTDIEVGPDGALYVLGWGAQYGSIQAPYQGGDKNAKLNEGRVFRIWYDKNPLIPRSKWRPAKRDKPYAQWTVDELIADLDNQVPVWRVDAQDELVRRGDDKAAQQQLLDVLGDKRYSSMQQTWAMWTLGRGAALTKQASQALVGYAADREADLNLRIQAMRVLARQSGEPSTFAKLLEDPEPRVRFEAVQAMRQTDSAGQVDAVLNAAVKETDRLCRYAQFRWLSEKIAPEKLRELLRDERAGVRYVAMLALAEIDKLDGGDALLLTIDTDEATAKVATLWMSKTGKSQLSAIVMNPSGGEFFDPVDVTLSTPIEGAVVRYTTDGSTPTAQSPAAKKGEPFRVTDTSVVTASLFRDGKPLGGALRGEFTKVSEAEWKSRMNIAGLKAASGAPYRLVTGGVHEGELAYIDRSYILKKFPSELEGNETAFIRTANNDSGKKSKGEQIGFDVNRDVWVYVAHDARTKDKPGWMNVGKDGGFEKVKGDVVTTDTKFGVYRKKFPAGRVTLGDNGAGKSMYMVFVTKADAAPRKTYNTKVADVLPLLKTGDATRGKAVFNNAAGVKCTICHRLDGHGAAVGPDLSDIGLRHANDAEYIAESVVDPNAKLIEGYLQAVVVTKGGDQYFGMIREESAKVLTLYQADGKLVTVNQSDVASRTLLNVSAMPPVFGTLLSPREVADLVTYLLTQKHKQAPTSVPPKGD